MCEKPIAGDLGVVRRHLVAFHGGKRHNAAERLTAEEHECQVCQKVFFVRDRRDEHLKNEHFRYSNKYRVMKYLSPPICCPDFTQPNFVIIKQNYATY